MSAVEIHPATVSIVRSEKPLPRKLTPTEGKVIRSIEQETGKKVSQEDKLKAALATSNVPASIGIARKLVRQKKKGARRISSGSATYVDGYFESEEINLELAKYDEVFEHTRGAVLSRSGMVSLVNLIIHII